MAKLYFFVLGFSEKEIAKKFVLRNQKREGEKFCKMPRVSWTLT